MAHVGIESDSFCPVHDQSSQRRIQRVMMVFPTRPEYNLIRGGLDTARLIRFLFAMSLASLSSNFSRQGRRP